MQKSKAETAGELGRFLAAVARRADEAGMSFLGYLVHVAEMEARTEEAKPER